MEARALKDKASAFFTKGRFAKAAETYEEFCAVDKKDHQARLRCGDAWSKAGKKDKAIIAYSMAAEGFAKDGFLPRAIAASKLVLEIDPAHQGVQKMLAQLYAQKSGASRKPAAAAAAPVEMEVTRGISTPVTSSFANTKAAIDLDVPVAAKPQPTGYRPAPVEAPSPMTRADALELPEYEIPMGDAPVNAIPVTSGHTPQRRVAAIEIEDVAAAQTGPRALVETTIDIDLSQGQSVSGEVEVPIEGHLLPDADQLPLELASTFNLPSPPGPQNFELDVPAPPSGVYELIEAIPEPTPSVSVFELTDEADAPAPPSVLPMSAVGGGREEPPGLKPRRAEAPSPLQPAAGLPSSSRIWLPPTFTPASAEESAPSLAAATPSRPSPAEPSTDLERSLQAFTQFDLDAPAPAAPGRRASFTELDLDEGDSLLHAVEAAAAPSRKAAEALEEAMDASDALRDDQGGLPKIPLFSDLPEDAFIALFEKCPLQRFDEGQLVFGQGDKADAFYVICAGQVRVFRTEGQTRKELATLEEGSFFGEMALLSEAPRGASVEAAGEDTQVLVISAEILKELSGSYPVVSNALKKFCRQRMLTNLMNQAALFAPFNRNDRRDLVQKFRARDVGRGEVLVKEGSLSDGLYVVLSGEVEIEAKGHRIATLKEGQVFGERSLLTRSPASATVRAVRHTSLLRLPKQDFDSLILTHPQVLEHVSTLIDERKKSDLERPQNDAAEML